MADLNISDFSQKTQNYIAKNNIDKNQDGKINQANGELQTLLSGKVDSAAENNSTNGTSRRAMGYFQFEPALEYFSELSQAEKKEIVDKTEEAQEAKLETLENTILSNYDSVRTAIKDVMFNTNLIVQGDGTKAGTVNGLRQFISDIADKFKEAQWNAAQAIDIYIGIRAYADECGLGSGYSDYSDYIHRIHIDDAEEQVMKRLGYNSIEEFVDEYDKYNMSNAGMDLDKILEYTQIRTNMIQSFQNKLYEVYESAIETRENVGKRQISEMQTEYNNSTAFLENAVVNPPTTHNERIVFINKISNPIGYTFMRTVLEYQADHKDTGVEAAKVKVNGKEYVVGKKYQEQGPDGKPRIVTFDRLGNKWDLRGFKVD